jgi:hypothetical protein
MDTDAAREQSGSARLRARMRVYTCAPGDDLTLLIDIGALPGERCFVEFIGPIEDSCFFTIAEVARASFIEAGPHEVRIPIPKDAPPGTYQLTGLALVRDNERATDFETNDLLHVFLKIDPRAEKTLDFCILLLRRPG